MRHIAVLWLVVMVGCGGSGKKATGGGGGDELPPAEADPESTEAGMIPPERYDEIDNHFRKKRPLVSRCYSDAVAQEKIDGKAKGTVTLNLSISPDGHPSNVRVTNTTLKNKVVEDCVVDMISGWSLPEPGGGCEFSFTYAFEPE